MLAGGECGPIDMPIIVGNDNYVRAKLLKRARRIEGYLETLASVVDNAARAYHAERLAFRVLKQTARPRAQLFLRPYAPEITEEAGCIVDEAMKKAEVKLLGWSEDEAKQAIAQASLGFEHGGHDMQEKTGDRYLLHLAAWLDAMEEILRPKNQKRRIWAPQPRRQFRPLAWTGTRRTRRGRRRLFAFYPIECTRLPWVALG